MTCYVIGCCDGTVAEIEVDAGHVTISPPPGTELYRLQAPARIENPSLDDEQMRVEYRARDQIHRLMMEWVEAENRCVSEIMWGMAAAPGRPRFKSKDFHSSWVVRCPACAEQIEVTSSNLRKLGRVLDAGDWSAVGGTVPLGVLHRKM